jgi:hypothetical protein
MGKCCTTTVKTQHFTSVTVQKNSVLSTAGSTLGVWVSHGKESSIYLSQKKIIYVSKYATIYPANLMVLILMRLCYVTKLVAIW